MATIKRISNNNRMIYGTSFHKGYIRASLLQICTALGIKAPKYEKGDKTHYDMAFELNDDKSFVLNGVVFTIYDWKESDLVNERTVLDYHIGTHTAEESRRIADILRNEYGLNAKCETEEELQARINAIIKTAQAAVKGKNNYNQNEK